MSCCMASKYFSKPFFVNRLIWDLVETFKLIFIVSLLFFPFNSSSFFFSSSEFEFIHIHKAKQQIRKGRCRTCTSPALYWGAQLLKGAKFLQGAKLLKWVLFLTPLSLPHLPYPTYHIHRTHPIHPTHPIQPTYPIYPINLTHPTHLNHFTYSIHHKRSCTCLSFALVYVVQGVSSGRGCTISL